MTVPLIRGIASALTVLNARSQMLMELLPSKQGSVQAMAHQGSQGQGLAARSQIGKSFSGAAADPHGRSLEEGLTNPFMKNYAAKACFPNDKTLRRA